MVAGPIFVVGAPRTGTTLMKELLNRHPDVYLFNELHFFERIWDGRERFGSCEEPDHLGRVAREAHQIVSAHGTDSAVASALSPADLVERARASGGGFSGLHAGILRAAAEIHAATRWGDSSPQDVLYLPTLFDWHPDARVVAMVRDPRAFLSSYKNYGRRAMSDYRERYNPLTVSLLWRSYMSALTDATSARHADAIHVQSYESLVSEPERSMRAVAAHVEVDFDPVMLHVERANSSYARGPGQPGISSASRDRWRSELEPTEQWLAERICALPMSALGYEPDGSIRPRVFGLLQIAASVPGRLFNMLFRGRKKLRLAKLQRIAGLLRRSAG